MSIYRKPLKEEVYGTNVEERFELFATECERLSKLWHVDDGWTLGISIGSARSKNWAECSSDFEQRIINIVYNKQEPNGNLRTEERIKTLARHEMVHALLAPMSAIFQIAEGDVWQRCVDASEHEVLRRLNPLLPR